MAIPIRVLMVEDSEDDALLLIRELRRGGYEEEYERVFSANHLRAALDDKEWDVITSDYKMPGFTGLQALQIVKEKGIDIPFILVSGAVGEDIAVEAMRQGCHDYLLKNRLTRLVPAIEREMREAVTREERREAEEAFQKSVEILRATEEELRIRDWALRSSINAIALADLEGNLTYVNPSFLQMWGYSDAEQVLGKSSLKFWQVKENAEEGIGALRERGSWVGELEATQGDGLRFPVQVSASMVADDAGKPVCMMASFLDITERKQLEEQFRQSQKLEAIGLLASGLAHDFNNILMAMMGHCDLMRRDIRPEDPMAKEVAQIRAGCRRAAALTSQLLAFSRKQTLQPQVLDLNTVVGDLEKMLRRLIGENIDFVLAFNKDLGRVKADLGQIEQVIMNLVVNARDAMPEGGKLTIETANLELDEEYVYKHVDVVPGRYVMLAITDTGCGMDEETMSRLFEPFFTTKEKGKGTGLGLSTLYGIVKQSGGNVWLYSELGKGTTFKIYLPRTEDEPVAKAERAEKEHWGGDALLLLVEDEPTLRDLFERMLEELDYRVTVAANGAEALLAIEEKALKPDLVITDMVMPGMSGTVLIERLRKTLPDLKVLYMSGYTDNAVIHQGVLDPGTPFIQKPFGIADLTSKIEKLLRGEGAPTRMS